MFCRYNKCVDFYKSLSNQTRYVQLKPKVIKNDEYYKRDSHRQILQDNLDLTIPQTYKLIRNNKFISEIKNIRLSNTLDMLNKIGVTKDDIVNNPLTLNYMDSTIEHNVTYLKEVGFDNISASMLLRFRIIVKRPISLLKLHGLIPENINVAERLTTFFQPIEKDSINLDDFTDDMTITEIHITLFKKYLTWRLQCEDKETDILFKTYDRFKYKSIQIASDLINLLMNEIKFTTKKILKHGYIFDVHPKQIRLLMAHFPTLGGEKIEKVFFKHPKLMAIPIENYYEILKHFQEFEVKNEAIQKCYDIFTLSPESIFNRFNELKKVPEFEVLSKNPRILVLLYYQNKAKLRLELLRNLNVKCASLHVLCSTEDIFEKYTQDGNDRTKGSDLLNYLSKELNRPFKDIRESLSCNQHWYHIPAAATKSSLKCLLEWGFPIEDIANSPVILLYSKDQLDVTLRDMEQKLHYNYLTLDFKQKLNLCLYEIEKKYYFSGNGVWNLNNRDTKKTNQT